MKLAHINTLLVAAIVAVNGYTIAMPVMPRLAFWWQGRDGTQRSVLEQKIKAPAVSTVAADRPNQATIPSMLLDQPILEGPAKDMYRILDKGIWRWPDGSTPDKGGNTVLLGHRFTYTNPNGVLYLLDRVRAGETIGLTWNNKQYVYKVSKVEVVPPTASQVTAPTEKPTLTIYTCTPLWKPANRLVVTAALERTL